MIDTFLAQSPPSLLTCSDANGHLARAVSSRAESLFYLPADSN